MPHYMFYAPNLTSKDMGGGPLMRRYPYFDQPWSSCRSFRILRTSCSVRETRLISSFPRLNQAFSIHVFRFIASSGQQYVGRRGAGSIRSFGLRFPSPGIATLVYARRAIVRKCGAASERPAALIGRSD
jgi:hypothetical protein